MNKALAGAVALGIALLLGATDADARNVRHGGHVNVNHNFHHGKNVNVHVNRHVHWDPDLDWDVYHHNPVARGIAVGTAAAVTTAAIGSIAHALPSGCKYQTINGTRYYHCGNTWYEQRYSGSQLVYVAVPRPG